MSKPKVDKKEKVVKWNSPNSYNLGEITREMAESKGVEVLRAWEFFKAEQLRKEIKKISKQN
jgi:hypothetical protein